MINKKIFGLALIPFSLYSASLNELVDISLKNKLVKATTNNVQSLESQYSSVKLGYLPSVNIGRKYQVTDKETAMTPDKSTTTYAKVSFVVSDGFKRSNTFDSLSARVDSAQSNLEDLKNKIALQVTNYYFNYLKLLANKDAKQKEIDTLKAEQSRLKQFLEAGTTTLDEVQKITSRVQSAMVSLHEIELNIQTILHNLEYITGQNVSIDDGSSIKDISSNSTEKRADIKSLEFDVKSLLANSKSARSGYLPSVVVDSTLNKYDNEYINSSYDNGVDEQVITSVNLSWNVFNFGSTFKAHESAYKKYLASKSQYEYEKNKASIDLKLAFKAYDIGKLKIDSAKAGLKAASSAYSTIQSKYKNGLVDNVAFLEALSEKYGAVAQLKSAQYDLEIKKADIVYHSGKNIMEYVK